ncbi:MAG: FixH family protein [Runella sp.]
MPWSKAIILSFVLFVSFIAALAYKMITAKVDLVSDDYYQRGVAFDTHIEQQNNAAQLKVVGFDAAKQELQFHFPTSIESGQIVFFRPSDRNLDFRLPIKPSSDPIFSFSTRALAKGRWKIQMTWKDNSREYFSEQTIDI